MTQSSEKKNIQQKRLRRRNWCFTDFSLPNLKSIFDENKDIIRYLAYGEEICPTTKRTHYQGWIQMVNPKDLNPVRRMLGGKAHLEPCMGTEYDNDKYCSKDGKYTQMGKFKSQGYRSDLEDIKKTIDTGGTMLDIWNSYPGDFVRYHPGFQKAIQLVCEYNTPKWRDVEVEIYYGSTGTGKTRRAMEQAEFIISGDELRWWDGYHGEKTICIDEYANNIPLPSLLSLLDGYKKRLAIKGGFTYAQWTRVLITTNLNTLHKNANEEHRRALSRRVTDVTNFSVTE